MSPHASGMSKKQEMIARGVGIIFVIAAVPALFAWVFNGLVATEMCLPTVSYWAAFGICTCVRLAVPIGGSQ